MRLSRIISAFAGALAIVATPAVAHAQNDYPPPPPSLTLSSTTITAGDTVVLTGRNYAPNELISITSVHRAIAAGRPGAATSRNGHTGTNMVTVAYRMPLADGGAPTPPVTVRDDASGSFSVRLRFNDPGSDVITATGQTSGLTASVTLTELPRGLPVTGSNLTLMSAGGGTLLLAGAGLFLMARRRRHRTATAAQPAG